MTLINLEILIFNQKSLDIINDLTKLQDITVHTNQISQDGIHKLENVQSQQHQNVRYLKY